MDHFWTVDLGQKWINFQPLLTPPTCWILKQIIQEELATQLGTFSESTHFVDGFPMSICKYARAYKPKLFCTKASYGYCAAKQEKYWYLKNSFKQRIMRFYYFAKAG